MNSGVGPAGMAAGPLKDQEMFPGKCVALPRKRAYDFFNNTNQLMGPIGMPEMIMIFVVILLLFGAKKLPELARGIGKSMGEFKKARDDFEKEITRAETDVRVKDAPGKEPQDT